MPPITSSGTSRHKDGYVEGFPVAAELSSAPEFKLLARSVWESC